MSLQKLLFALMATLCLAGAVLAQDQDQEVLEKLRQLLADDEMVIDDRCQGTLYGDRRGSS